MKWEMQNSEKTRNKFLLREKFVLQKSHRDGFAFRWLQHPSRKMTKRAFCLKTPFLVASIDNNQLIFTTCRQSTEVVLALRTSTFTKFSDLNFQMKCSLVAHTALNQAPTMYLQSYLVSWCAFYPLLRSKLYWWPSIYRKIIYALHPWGTKKIYLQCSVVVRAARHCTEEHLHFLSSIRACLQQAGFEPITPWSTRLSLSRCTKAAALLPHQVMKMPI